MLLTEEQYEVIEQMAGCNYAPAKIAVYLGLSKHKFLEAWYNRESQIRYHYDRGLLRADYEISSKRLSNAMSGNLTADQQHQKETEKRKFENAKKEILFCGSYLTPLKNEQPKKITETRAGGSD